MLEWWKENSDLFETVTIVSGTINSRAFSNRKLRIVWLDIKKRTQAIQKESDLAKKELNFSRKDLNEMKEELGLWPS